MAVRMIRQMSDTPALDERDTRSFAASADGNAAAVPAPTKQAAAPMKQGGALGADGRGVGWYVRRKFAVVRGLLRGWVRLFGLRGLFVLGRWFGTIEYLINFKRRARYRRELRRVFPDGITRSRQQKITLGYFRRTRCDKLYYLIFDGLPREKTMRRIRFHGREYLDAALARGNGVYVMLSHQGSHHVAGLLMALLGYRCAGVRDRNEGAIRVYMQERYATVFPEFRSIRMLYADSFPRDIFRCFHENRVVGSALDVGRVRGLALKTCPVKIFGETRDFLTGPLEIALRCNATIVQAFVVSRPNFYFRLIVKPPLLIPDGTETDAPQVQELMQRYADGIQAHVHEYPDHLSRI